MDPKLVGKLKAATHLALAPDKLQASCTMSNPGNEFQDATEDDVRQILSILNLRYGVDPDAVRELCAALRRGDPQFGPLTIARGLAPQKGRPGEVTLHFSTALKAGEALANGRINYRERGAVQQVAEGETLAVVTPPVPGTPGRDVEGKDVPPPKLKPFKPPRAGDGVRFDAASNCYLAATAGNVVYKDNTLSVTPEVVIPGDVDYTVGNIRFNGNVLVQGKVAGGFTVEAAGCVTVRGDVEAKACVIGGGAVAIAGTVRGKGKDEAPSVRSGASLALTAVTDASVFAEGDVAVTGPVLNSTLRTWSVLTHCGPDASLRGSTVEAIGGMTLTSVGTAEGAPNRLTVGITAQVAARMAVLKEEIRKLTQHCNHVFESFHARYGELLRKADLTAAERADIDAAKQQASAKQEELEKRLHVLKEEHHALGEVYREDPTATLVIEGQVFPVTCIQVYDRDYVLSSEPRTNVIFYHSPKGVLCQGKDKYDERQRLEAADPDELLPRFKRGALNLSEILTGIDRYNALGEPAVLQTALAVGVKAVKMREFQHPATWAEIARTMVLIARRLPEGPERERILTQARTAAGNGMERGRETPNPLATLGMIAAARGDYTGAMTHFRGAVDLLTAQRAKFRREEPVLVLYAQLLADLAEKMSQAGRPQNAERFTREAATMAGEYLARQARGAWADAARALQPQTAV